MMTKRGGDTHFPPEVRQAYDALLVSLKPTDLFRLCVHLIRGGLMYADVDIVLESNLDAVVGPDVGFLVPFDCMVRFLCMPVSGKIDLYICYSLFARTCLARCGSGTSHVPMEWLYGFCSRTSILSQGRRKC
jgi:hypothetical protein